MSIAQKFEKFINNLKIPEDKVETIRNRYQAITKRLNIDFWGISSETKHSLYVGSYGRDTDIKTSDIDILFWLPCKKYKQYNNYQSNGQSALLQEVKNSISKTYSQTKIRADGQVIVIDFSDGICFELLPCFKDKEDDDIFYYVDTNDGGKWKETKPKLEKNEIKEKNNEWNKNLKRLCRMIRAWRDNCGVSMGGLLVDTLAYKFLKDYEHKDKSFVYYDWMTRDFFKFLSEQDDKQEYWLAVGSNQKIYNQGKFKFKRKAKKAYELALKAIEYENKEQEYSANEKWRDIFGIYFPKENTFKTESINSYNNTEEFIENKFEINIKFDLKIDCEVTQNGFRTRLLSEMLSDKISLFKLKRLKFYIVKNTTIGDYEVYWKVLNRGKRAKEKDCIRGDIVKDSGYKNKIEHTDFMGNHYVECYIVQNNIVVARDKIEVPIKDEIEK